MQINKEKIKSIIEYVLIFLIFFVGIRKGGYYKEDSLIFVYIIQLVALLHCLFNDKIKINYVVGICLIFFCISYFLPVIIGNVATISGALNIGIRIYSMFLIYLVVTNSKNKEKYIKSIVSITLVFGILALDEMSFRIFERPLNFLGGGYISEETSRVSSVLQYSNILGILCLISIIYLYSLLKKVNKSITNVVILKILITFFTIIVLLTESKMVLLLYLIVGIVSSFIEKKVENIFYIALNLLISIVIVLLVKQISIFVIIPSIIAMIVYFILEEILKNKKRKYLFLYNAICISIIIAIFIFGFNYIENIGIISSIEDYLHNFNSTKLRFIYYQDALKLIVDSPLNFIFGLGGNAFRTMYETVQSIEYISLETHSFFVQVFLESGVIGLISIIIPIIYLLKNSKNFLARKILFVLIIFATFDVFLTYTFMLFILAIIMAFCDVKQKEVNLKFKAINIIIYTSIFVLQTLQVIAFFIEPIEVNNLNKTLNEQEKIINRCEIALKLDPFDIEYIRNCNVAYTTYLEMLEIKKELYGSDYTISSYDIVNKIYKNIEIENIYEKSNKYALEDNIYYINKYVNELVFSNYSNDIEKGYEYYLGKLINNLDRLRLEHNKNNYAIDIYNELSNDVYSNYSSINLTINSQEISNRINTLKENII